MQETEAKLLVVARPVAPLWRVLGALTYLGEFALVASPDQTLEDTYFDTADGRLRQADLALRLRYAAGRCTVALKGKSRHMGNVVTRLELEQAYSRDALRDVLGTLGESGIVLQTAKSPTDETPEQALAAHGLLPWQGRTTARERREVRRRPSGTVAAELALDACWFHVGGRQVRHYEIEIESVGQASVDEIGSMATALMALFGAGVRPWRHSKVATHAGLAALAERLGLDAMLDGEALLKPGVYADIEQFLTGSHYP